ncbi:F-box/kelch-repeat protein At3g23880-like [Nicotiana sylvestris]|uniref:F-box protein At3g18910-like n=1 Tax=Nicotiana sylvestris TaxID=4096 RepID=A0A1U7XGU1_NICSY|nr:PREDICTED: F-box protein At3g18910-like [Nicotiana sylvestris]
MSKKKLHKRSVTEKDTFGLPYDILSDILIKVPVKSLLRFKSISKPWNAIISGDEFIKAHRDQSKALGRRKLLLQSKYTGEFELMDLENPKVVTVTQDQESPLKNSHVLCSLDGLVLLDINMLDETFALWNPSTRQHQTLRCPYLINSTRARACGLCYDCTVHDYKVILIYILFYVVYSTNTDFWTMKTMFPIFEVLELYYGSRGINRGISTEGRVYWSLDWELLNQGVRKVSTIIYFDVKLDELKELPTEADPGF